MGPADAIVFLLLLLLLALSFPFPFWRALLFFRLAPAFVARRHTARSAIVLVSQVVEVVEVFVERDLRSSKPILHAVQRGQHLVRETPIARRLLIRYPHSL